MDTPIFIERPAAAAETSTRLRRRWNPLRSLKRNWTMAVIVAAAPGSAWVLTGFLTLDALFLGACASDRPSEATPVSAIASFPFLVARGHWCHTGGMRDWMIARRNAQGAWSILPCTNQDEYQAQLMLNYEETQTADTATVRIGRAYSSSIGLWSPLVSRELGRQMTVNPLDAKFTSADELAVRAAAVASWSKPDDHVMVYSYPLDQAEAAAALTGARPEKFTLRPLAVANDAAVAGVLTLLIASQPRRYRRRRADRLLTEQTPLTHCPDCRYDLTGLTVDGQGDRTCPECGRVCGQVF